MFRFRTIRVLHDVAGEGGGSGGSVNTDPNNPQGGNPAWDPNAGGNPQANKDQNGGQQKNPAKDPSAESRYNIQRYRESAEKANKEVERLKAELAKTKPTFDSESDPDGSKERQWEIQREAQELLSKQLKELGVEEKLAAIQYEKEEREFFEVVGNEAKNFEQYGIEAPTKEELKKVLTTLDNNWITPEQVIMLAKAQQIFERMKSGGFKPWTGAKPVVNTPKTQEEINAEIYKATWAFWFWG